MAMSRDLSRAVSVDISVAKVKSKKAMSEITLDEVLKFIKTETNK